MAEEIITHEKTVASFNLAEALVKASTEHGRTFGGLVTEIVRTSFGNGRLKPEEYFFFRLYERAYSVGERSRFVAGSWASWTTRSGRPSGIMWARPGAR